MCSDCENALGIRKLGLKLGRLREVSYRQLWQGREGLEVSERDEVIHGVTRRVMAAHLLEATRWGGARFRQRLSPRTERLPSAEI